MKNLQNFQKLFDIAIFQYLRKKEAQLSQIDSDASVLIRILTEFIKNGGKRIRPALFYYASVSYGGDKEDALMRSMAFELFQTFCLIHDDLIDKSDLRRGKPTVHTKYGQATAILSGDMAMMIADEVFLKFESSERVKKTYNIFKQEVILGEYLESIGSKDTQKVMDLKTARYSFVRPVELAFFILNRDQQLINIWKKVLHEIGMIFQLKDDLMGVFGKKESIGKSTTSDLQEGKYTQLIEFFDTKASSSKKQQFYHVFKQGHLSEKDSHLLRNMLKEENVPEKMIDKISKKNFVIKQDLKKIHEVPLHHILYDILAGIEDMSVIALETPL